MKIVAVIGMLAGLFLVNPSALAADQAGENAVRDSLGSIKPDRIAPAAIAGLYEVVIGPHVFYVSADGKYMIQGDLMDLGTRKNLTEPVRLAAQQAAIDGIGEDNMLIFSPEKPKHTITVFTDIDCGYCRKLHQEIGRLNELGIKVRYLMFPRAGVNSHSYEKAVSVWCADDPKSALTTAKSGKEPEAKQCDNPVKEHMAMGQMIGVQGTPTIVMENGDILPGYVPADRLAAMLDQQAAAR